MTPFAPELTLWPLLLLLAIGALWVMANRRLCGDGLSPFNLLFFAWVGPLILQASNLSTLETTWSTRSTVVVAWTTLTLFAVSLFATAFVTRRVRTPEAASAFESLLMILRRPTVLIPLACLHVAALGAMIYAEFVTNPGGVPLIAAIGRSELGVPNHRWGKDSPWQAVVALLFVLTPMAFLAYKATRGRLLRGALLAMALLYPALGVLKLSRSDVFNGMLMIGAAAVYHRVYTQLDRRGVVARYLPLAGIFVVALAVYYAMMSIRIASVPIEDIYAEMIGFRLPEGTPLRGLLAALYGYLGLPFENLHRMIEASDGSLHLGISVFRPFLSLSGLGDLADRLDTAVFYPALASPAAGSATFLTAAVAELGLLGVVLVPLAYAFLVNVLYVRMRRAPTLLNLLLYLNFIYPWIWLFFNNAFGVLSIYLNAGLVVAVTLVANELPGRHRRFVAAPSQ